MIFHPDDPNKLVYPAKTKTPQIAAKDALKFLEKRGIIHSFDWDYIDGDPESWEFHVFTVSPSHPPLVLDTDEALAFARGARAQRNLQEAP